MTRAFVLCLGVFAGCVSAPAGSAREVAVGGWNFNGIGDRAADHVFTVLVLPLRNGRQGARVMGIVGGAGISRIRPVGPEILDELSLVRTVPGENGPAVFRWDVEGLSTAGTPIRARIEAVIPRLPAQDDPNDPLQRARIDDLSLEAHADILFEGGTRAFATGDPPLEEPVFLDDPYKIHTLGDGSPDPLWGRTPRRASGGGPVPPKRR